MKFTKHTISLLLAVSLLTPVTLAGRTSAEMPVGLFDIFRKEEAAETEPVPEDVPPKRGNHSPCKEKDCAASPEASGWYCKHMDGGKRPPMPGEMTFIDKHGGYFLGEDDKVLYLTFDAGYENGNVARILDTLKAEEVPAAFFILENLVTRNPIW